MSKGKDLHKLFQEKYLTLEEQRIFKYFIELYSNKIK